MKITKEQLGKDNAVLKNRVESIENTDLFLRTTLSEILESFKQESVMSMSYHRRETEVLSWHKICFEIGRLKEKATTGGLFERNQELQQTINRLEDEKRALDSKKEPGREY